MVKLFIQGLFARWLHVGLMPASQFDIVVVCVYDLRRCVTIVAVSLGGQGRYNGLYSGFGHNLFKQVLDVTVHDGDCDGEAVHTRPFARELHVELVTASLFDFVNEHQAGLRSKMLISRQLVSCTRCGQQSVLWFQTDVVQAGSVHYGYTYLQKVALPVFYCKDFFQTSANQC